MRGFLGFAALFAALGTSMVGCAGMDLRVESMPGPGYRKYQTRSEVGEIKVYYGEPDRPYVVIAKYIVQETPQVIMARSKETTINYVAKRARSDGADAIIVDNFDVVNVAGVARQSMKIWIRGIRFKE